MNASFESVVNRVRRIMAMREEQPMQNPARPAGVIVIVIVRMVVVVVVPVRTSMVVARAVVVAHCTPRKARASVMSDRVGTDTAPWCAGVSVVACSALWTASVTSLAMCSLAIR